ncbi:hypothetical protein COCCADRAFT_101857, partial [Bipolaris zeicola 26-R-13]
FNLDIELANNKPYIKSYSSDKCKKEVDNKDKENFNSTSNYLIDKQYEALKA